MADSKKGAIESTLLDASGKADTESILRETSRIVQQELLKTTSKIGTAVDQVVAGFAAKTQSVDDVVEDVDGSKPVQTTGNLDVVQMTADVPGLSSKLTKTVSTEDKTTLTTLTGNATQAGDGFMDVVVAAPFPSAMLAAVKEAVSDVSPAQLKAVADEIVDISQPLTRDLDKAATSVINGVDDFELIELSLTEAVNDVVKDVMGSKTFNSQLERLYGQISRGSTAVERFLDNGFGVLIENSVEKTLNTAGAELNKLASIGDVKSTIPQAQIKSIVSYVKREDFNAALGIVRKYSDAPDVDIINALRSIDNRLSTVAQPSTGGISVSKVNINIQKNDWNEEKTPLSYFQNNYIRGGIDEVAAEFGNVERDITEIIVHCTYTGTDVVLTNEDLQQMAVENYNGTAFHYVITRAGLIERGRPIDVQNKPSPALPNSHHLRSVQVLLVGGINAPHPQNNEDMTNFYSARSYTSAQWGALDTLFKGAYTSIPGLQALSISDVTDNRPGPFFDVAEFVESRYGKRNAFEDPSTQQPFTKADLANNIVRV